MLIKGCLLKSSAAEWEDMMVCDEYKVLVQGRKSNHKIYMIVCWWLWLRQVAPSLFHI